MKSRVNSGCDAEPVNLLHREGGDGEAVDVAPLTIIHVPQPCIIASHASLDLGQPCSIEALASPMPIAHARIKGPVPLNFRASGFFMNQFHRISIP